MAAPDSPVTQDELHALVDGELPADRLTAVSAWLATHPDDAALVAQWRGQAEAVRARYGAVADEPLEGVAPPERPPGRQWLFLLRRVAVVIVFLAPPLRGAFGAGRCHFRLLRLWLRSCVRHSALVRCSAVRQHDALQTEAHVGAQGYSRRTLVFTLLKCH